MLDYFVHYRKCHNGSRAHFDGFSHFYRHLLGEALASASPEARILDIGRGRGALVYALSGFGRRSTMAWLLQRFFRALRRLKAVGEMGSEGWKVPLSLNLLARCVKTDA
jgi:hypothetical protein